MVTVISSKGFNTSTSLSKSLNLPQKPPSRAFYLLGPFQDLCLFFSTCLPSAHFMPYNFSSVAASRRWSLPLLPYQGCYQSPTIPESFPWTSVVATTEYLTLHAFINMSAHQASTIQRQHPHQTSAGDGLQTFERLSN